MAARGNQLCDFRPILALQGMLNSVPLPTLEEAVVGPADGCLADCDPSQLDSVAVRMPPRQELVSLCKAALEMARDSSVLRRLPPKISGIDRENLVAAIILNTMEEPFPFYRLLTQPLNIKGTRSRLLLKNQLPYFKLLMVALRSIPRDSDYWCKKVLYRGENVHANPILQEKYDNYHTAYAPGVKLTLAAPTSTTTDSDKARNFTKGIQANQTVSFVQCRHSLNCFGGAVHDPGRATQRRARRRAASGRRVERLRRGRSAARGAHGLRGRGVYQG
jgi:hypothetical protein